LKIVFVFFFSERIQIEIERRRLVEQDNESMKKRAEDLEISMQAIRQGSYNVEHV